MLRCAACAASHVDGVESVTYFFNVKGELIVIERRATIDNVGGMQENLLATFLDWIEEAPSLVHVVPLDYAFVLPLWSIVIHHSLSSEQPVETRCQHCCWISCSNQWPLSNNHLLLL